MTDIVIFRAGELTPEITEPTVIGAIVRIVSDTQLPDAINLAKEVIDFPEGATTETMRVIVGDVEDITG